MANRPRGYGMTADVKKKMDAKYDPALEVQAKRWIEEVTETTFPEFEKLKESLKDGIILCQLINILLPNSIKKIHDSKMPFKMMENIGNFLTAATEYGVARGDLFQTVDLYEGVNMPQVVNGIHALGRKAQKNGYEGPTIGPKEASSNRRNFTEAQMRGGETVIGLQMGSPAGASQKGMSGYGARRDINWMDKYK